jgi:CRP-like cAMP-binding protein
MASSFGPLVRKLQRLYPLTDDERHVIEGLCSRKIEVPKYTDIVQEGDKPLNSNLLLQGVICRYVLMPDGGRQIQSFHTPGDIVDAHSFLLDVMDHNIKTLTTCSIAVIPHEKLRAVTEAHPGVARAIWKDTLMDGAIFRQWIANVGRRNAFQRLAHLICEIFTKFEVVGLADSLTIDWPLTQADLGDATGLSVVHVNRTLKELREAKLITIGRDKLTIPNWDALKAAGEFDPKYLQLGGGSGDARSLH